MHYGYFFSPKDANSKELRKAKHERNIKPLLDLYNEDPTDVRNLYHMTNEYFLHGKNEKAKEIIEAGLSLFDPSTDNPFYHAIYYNLLKLHGRSGDDDAYLQAVEEYLESCTVQHQRLIQICSLYAAKLASVGRYSDAVEASGKAYDYFLLNKQGKLDAETARVGELGVKYLTDEGESVKQLVFTNSLAGNFDDAFGWAEKYEKIEPDIPKPQVYAEYAGRCTRDDVMADMANIYNHALTRDAGDLSDAIASIEKSITSSNKADIATAIISCNAGDDYTRLHMLRSGDMSVLPLLLAATPQNGQHYGDVLLSAIEAGTDPAPWLERVQLTNSADFAARIINTNKNACDTLLAWMDAEHWASIASVKMSRIMADIAASALSYSANAEMPDARKVQLFDAAVRLRHIYLSTVMNPEAYNDKMAPSLSEGDAFTYFAAQALMLKDAGDKLSYVMMLRVAVKLQPAMKDIVKLAVEE
jgi:tetratricopeptide (TPR) repeat protein